MEKVGPFKYINALCDHRWLEVVDKEYNQFLVNRFFSYFIDTAMFANLASQFKDIDNQSHFNYYYGTIRKKKRFVPKWYKGEKSMRLTLLCKHYDISEREARLLFPAVSEETWKQIENIEKEKEQIV